MAIISDESLDTLFRTARTYNVWQDKPVADETLREAFDLMKMGPTSANCQPLRILFVRSPEAKEKLRPCLDAGNVDKTMKAPVTAIFGMDLTFYEQLPKLFPHADAKSWFVGKPEFIATTAFRNGSLQGAYFMLAARACGLDCGPMSGFNNQMVDQVFFQGTPIRSNFICNLGYGSQEGMFPRSPRPEFDDFCRIR